MKKTLLIIAFVLFGLGSAVAQQGLQKQQEQQPVQILTPTVMVGDVVFVYQTLNTIEIKGSEADAFLVVQSFYKDLVQEFSTSKRKVEDSLEIKIPLPVAQNSVALLERATFTGVNAERYKRYVNGLVESANKLKQGKGNK